MGFALGDREDGAGISFPPAGAEAMVVGETLVFVPGAPRLAGRLVQKRWVRVRREVTVEKGGFEVFGVEVGFAVETVTMPDGTAPLMNAAKGAVLISALVTTMLPSIVMVTGWARLKLARQLRLVRLAAKRWARKVYRSTATSGAGLCLPVKRVFWPWMKIPALRKFLQ